MLSSWRSSDDAGQNCGGGLWRWVEAGGGVWWLPLLMRLDALGCTRRCPSCKLSSSVPSWWWFLLIMLFTGRSPKRCSPFFSSFTPWVEKLSVDEAFLDVSGFRHHYREVTEVGRALRKEVHDRLGLPASVGIAATKTLAKLASQDAKPDGLLLIPSDESLNFLHSLSVRRLWGVGEATARRLHGLGIRTIGDLAAIPVEHLRPVVGSAAAQHLSKLAAGTDERPIVTDPVGVSLSVENTFEHDLYSRPEIEVKLRGQAERLASRLQQSQAWASTITLKVRFSDFATITRSHTRGTPTRLAIDIYRQVTELLDRAGLEGRAVRLLGISVGGLSHGEALPQLDLGGDKRWECLEDEVFRLRRRFGFEAVMPARISRPTKKK